MSLFLQTKFKTTELFGTFTIIRVDQVCLDLVLYIVVKAN